MKIQNFRDNHLGKGIFKVFFSQRNWSLEWFSELIINPKMFRKSLESVCLVECEYRFHWVLGNKKNHNKISCFNVMMLKLYFFKQKKLLRNFSNNTFHGNLRGLYLPPSATFFGNSRPFLRGSEAHHYSLRKTPMVRLFRGGSGGVYTLKYPMSLFWIQSIFLPTKPAVV